MAQASYSVYFTDMTRVAQIEDALEEYDGSQSDFFKEALAEARGL